MEKDTKKVREREREKERKKEKGVNAVFLNLLLPRFSKLPSQCYSNGQGTWQSGQE